MAMRAAGYDRNGNPIKTTAAKPKPPAEDPRLKEAREKAEQAKQKLINAAKMLGKIAMDELGITAALDCLTTGDLGACDETLINVASSFVGGLASKIASKYGAPWKWKKAYELGQKIWNLGKELVDGVTAWFKNLKLIKQLLAGSKTNPIEEVKVGDVVLATDPVTGHTSYQTVAATIIGTGSKTSSTWSLTSTRATRPRS